MKTIALLTLMSALRSDVASDDVLLHMKVLRERYIAINKRLGRQIKENEKTIKYLDKWYNKYKNSPLTR
jgi:hypothetical protein